MINRIMLGRALRRERVRTKPSKTSGLDMVSKFKTQPKAILRNKS